MDVCSGRSFLRSKLVMQTTTESSLQGTMNISFITSNKGQLLLLLDQYLFRCHKKTAKKKYWVCIHNGCKVSIHTDINDTYVCGGDTQHDHEPNPEMIAIRKVRQKMKERALEETIPTTMIYEQEVSNASLDSMTLAVLPTSLEMSTCIKL